MARKCAKVRGTLLVNRADQTLTSILSLRERRTRRRQVRVIFDMNCWLTRIT